jgi:hypothetical protein
MAKTEHCIMNNNPFVLGNIILGVALVLLLFMGHAWEMMGPAAMVLWVALAATGVALLMKDPKQ